MTSVQRFIANHTNLVAGADLTASSVATSTVVRTTSVDRAGNGRVHLTGAYTGHEDASVDIEIASGGSTLRASEPVFTGVGNGTLAVTAIGGGAVAESLTFTLVDLGTETTAATLDVAGITLRARTAGAVGNAVRLSATPDLTATASDYSLLDAWPAGSETLDGVEYDFGGYPLSAKRELDAATPRLRFGTEPTVYRPYRAYSDGAWRYGVTPAPNKAVAAGTRVYTITNGYDITVEVVAAAWVAGAVRAVGALVKPTVANGHYYRCTVAGTSHASTQPTWPTTGGTVTDGTATWIDAGAISEAYADVVTLYDLLTALAASDLIEVDGVVTVDRTPGGMAMRDVPLRTASWVLSATGVELSGLAPAADAPTETITVACTNADTIGAETWTVAGTVSGELGSATTGSAFTSPVVEFTVPAKAAGGAGATSYATRYEPVTRADGEGTPAVCVHDVTLGANARPMSVTYTYTQRGTDAGLDCNAAVMAGRIDLALLGLEGGDMALDAELKSRLLTIYEWRRTFMESSVILGTNIYVNSFRRKLIDSLVSLSVARLNDIYESSAGRAAWDTIFEAMQADVDGFDNAVALSTATSIVTSPHTGTINVGGQYNAATGGYRCMSITKISDSERETSVTVTALVTTGWSTGDTPFSVNDGTYTLVFAASEAQPTTLIDGKYSQVFDDSTDKRSIADEAVRELVVKYQAQFDVMLINVDILPKSDASSRIGDGSWRDTGASAWWMDKTGTYFPVFSNTAYITASQSCGSGASAGIPEGQPYSTREIGFWIAVDGEQYLKEGDTVTITIASVDGARPYTVGDKAEIQIVTAGPAYLAGGVTGDDTQSWSVLGSVSSAQADYEVPTDGTTIPAYTDAGVTVQLAAGGIPFALGDAFGFDVEAGQFKWRKNAGTWSSLTDIAASVSLSDGLSAAFTAGAAPSFVAADAWSFGIEQPNAPSHLTAPTDDTWAWSGASATLTVDLGGTESIGGLALAGYDLPAGATVTVSGGDGTLWPESVTLDVTGAVAVEILDTPWAVSHLKITIGSATGGRLGWFWAGDPLATSYSADRCVINRVYAVTRGNGLNPSRLYAGQGAGGEIGWDGFLTQTDLTALLALLDHVQAAAEPFILVPHYLHPADAALVRADFDEISIEDRLEYHPDSTADRRIALTLPLAAQIQ